MELKLVGSRITKIDAKRDPDFSGQLKLDTKININNIEWNTTDKQIENIKVRASHTIDYGKLGNIDIEGILFVSGDKKDLKVILKQFESKNYKTEEMITIMNLVLQKFSLKAFTIEEELGLPMHIKLPSLQTKK